MNENVDDYYYYNVDNYATLFQENSSWLELSLANSSQDIDAKEKIVRLWNPDEAIAVRCTNAVCSCKIRRYSLDFYFFIFVFLFFFIFCPWIFFSSKHELNKFGPKRIIQSHGLVERFSDPCKKMLTKHGEKKIVSKIWFFFPNCINLQWSLWYHLMQNRIFCKGVENASAGTGTLYRERLQTCKPALKNKIRQTGTPSQLF